jgi:DNA modification methylase
VSTNRSCRRHVAIYVVKTNHVGERESAAKEQRPDVPAKNLRIETWPIDRLRPHERQLRKHDHAIDRMIASIQEFGFKVPILARSSGEIVDGHLRLKAAHKVGLHEIPVILCDEWSDAQVKAFRLLVNRSASWANWDEDLLVLEMQELKVLDFDLALTGFEPMEIDDLLLEDQPAEEELPALPTEAITRPGDVWLCGQHRVGCGDATSGEDVRRLLGPAVPVLMVTDPPYGVDYDPRWRERAGLGHQRQTGLVSNDHQADWSQAYKLFAGDVAYVWHAGVHAAEVAAGLEGAGFRIRGQIIWLKQHFALSRGDYHWKHEPCWYAVREGKSSGWNGDRTQSTVWEVPNLNPIGGSRDEEATGHSTQKPVEVMQRPIRNNTRRGEIVYDPFLGSGTTLVAAEASGRLCYAMELDPRYVDLSVRRWQQLTGRVAVREADGLTFDETLAAEVANAATEV